MRENILYIKNLKKYYITDNEQVKASNKWNNWNSRL